MKRLKAKKWTDEEVRVLTTMVRQKSTASEIASVLGRHIASVKRMANEFCLPVAKKQTSVIDSWFNDTKLTPLATSVKPPLRTGAGIRHALTGRNGNQEPS